MTRWARPVLAASIAASVVAVLAGCGSPLTAVAGHDTGPAYATTGPEPTANSGPDPGGPPGTFTISGGVAGLYPGAIRPYVITVSNPNAYPITVITLSASVTSPKAGCAASNLTVTKFLGHLPLAAKHSVHMTLTAKMAHAAPDPCQGVTFHLHYVGMGVVP